MHTYEIQVWIGPGIFERIIIKAGNLQTAKKMAEAQTGGKVKASRALPS
jgi:hypothetical protein